MREALSLHHVRFDSHERLECFSVHDYRKKNYGRVQYGEITRFTMNRLRNSQTMSDEENNDRKFSSLVREGVCVGGEGVTNVKVSTKCSTLGSRPLSPFPYRIQQGINFSWKLKIPTLEVVTKNGLGKKVTRLQVTLPLLSL